MLGIFSKGVTPHSGLVGLIMGFLAGFARLVMQATHEMYGVDYGPIQGYVDMNWLYFSFFLFVFTCAVIGITSRFTPPASTEQLAGLTYKSVSAQQLAVDRETYGFWEIFHTVVILGIIVAIYVYFW
jgi:SSS family solute:Na+ symporter